MIFGPMKSDVYLYIYAAAIGRGGCDPDKVARQGVKDYDRFKAEARAIEDAEEAAREAEWRAKRGRK